MHLPYPFKDNDSAHFLKDLEAEHFTKSNEHAVNFNQTLKTPKRPPIRLTYTMRGYDTLLTPMMLSQQRYVTTELERFLFKHMPCQRGLLTLPVISRPHLLPIPYPRDFFSAKLSEKGLYSSSTQPH